MKYQFFQIPVAGPAEATEALNRFVASHRVIAVERQLIADGQESFWALSVTYAEAETAPGRSGGSGGSGTADDQARGRKPKVDYREVLNQEDFAVFAALRTLRKELSERESVPAYALFTNEQLAALVQNRVRTAAAMAEIEGVGKARVEKYGAAFLHILCEQLPAAPAPGGEGGGAPGGH